MLSPLHPSKFLDHYARYSSVRFSSGILSNSPSPCSSINLELYISKSKYRSQQE